MKYKASHFILLLVALLALSIGSASAELLVSGAGNSGAAPGAGIIGVNVAELNGKLFAVGQYGFGGGQENSKVYMSEDGVNWTLATNSGGWRGRTRPGLVAFNGKLYLIGGHPASGGYSDVWSSEDGINWTEVTSDGGFPGRGCFNPVVKDGKIWIAGGMEGGDSYFKSDVWYSEDGENWTAATTSAPWGPRSGHATVVVGNEILVFGGAPVGGGSGWNVQGYTDVWASTDGASWTTKTMSMSKHVLTSAAVFDGTIVCYGGASGASIWSGGDIISVSEDAGATWTDYTIDEGMMDMAVANFKGKLAVVGGNDLPAWNLETAEMNPVIDIPDFAARPKIHVEIGYAGTTDNSGSSWDNPVADNMNNAFNRIRDGVTSGIILVKSGTITRTLAAKLIEANSGEFNNGRSYTVLGGVDDSLTTLSANFSLAGETVIDFAGNASAKLIKTQFRGTASNPSTNPVNFYNLTFKNAGADGAPIEIVHKDGAIEADYTFAACNFIDGTAGTGAAIRFGEQTSPANLILTDCQFINNHATVTGGSGGGAIHGANMLTLGMAVTRCTFHNNTTDGDVGGAIYLTKAGGTANVTDWIFQDCTITSNVANTAAVHGGGGFLCFKPGLKPHLQLIDCVISENHCGGRGGGAIFTENSGTACDLTVDGCTVTSNTCANGNDVWGDLGGGFVLWDRNDPAQVTFVDSYFGFNRSGQTYQNKYGGGVMPVTCGLDVEGCTFEGNFAHQAGGCFAVFELTGEPDAIQVRDSYFIGNQVGDGVTVAWPRGGAIFSWTIHYGNMATDVDFTNCVFAYNQAVGAEGALVQVMQNAGLDYAAESDFTWTNCSFVGNRSVSSDSSYRCMFETDGGWANLQANIDWKWVNCLFAENMVQIDTGMFENIADPGDVVDSCHFYNTRAENGAVGIHWHAAGAPVNGRPTVINCNVADVDYSGGGDDPRLANLVPPPAESVSMDVFGLGTPVTDFMQLTSSTLIDAGADTHTSVTIPTADFAGVTRPLNLGVDIGAFEVKTPIELNVAPLSIAFGAWELGETTSTLVDLAGAINGDIEISSVDMVGDAVFSLSGVTTGTLVVSGSDTFTVTFTTSLGSIGSYSGTVVITGDGDNMPISIPVTGNVIAPDGPPTAVQSDNWMLLE